MQELFLGKGTVSLLEGVLISGVSLEKGSTIYLISPTQLDNEFNPFPTDLCRWRAKVILLRIPVRDRPEVQLKAIAYGALDHRREKWGYDRKWLGNYLTLQVCWFGWFAYF